MGTPPPFIACIIFTILCVHTKFSTPHLCKQHTSSIYLLSYYNWKQNTPDRRPIWSSLWFYNNNGWSRCSLLIKDIIHGLLLCLRGVPPRPPPLHCQHHILHAPFIQVEYLLILFPVLTDSEMKHLQLQAYILWHLVIQWQQVILLSCYHHKHNLGYTILCEGGGSPTPLHCQHHIFHPKYMKWLTPPAEKEKN